MAVHSDELHQNTFASFAESYRYWTYVRLPATWVCQGFDSMRSLVT